MNPKPGFAGPSWRLGIVTSAAVLACGGGAKPPRVVPSAANTTLINQDGRKIGSAAVLPSKAGGLLVLKLTRVPPGPHGLHLHARGVCDPPMFDSAGPHYNPGGRKHGARNPQGPHAGDLPNVRARADSSVDTTITIPAAVVSAIGAGPAAKTLVLHAGADDMVTDPSGSSGARIACGVLER